MVGHHEPHRCGSAGGPPATPPLPLRSRRWPRSLRSLRTLVGLRGGVGPAQRAGPARARRHRRRADADRGGELRILPELRRTDGPAAAPRAPRGALLPRVQRPCPAARLTRSGAPWQPARDPDRHRARMAVPEPHPHAPVLAYPLGDALYVNLTSGCTLACTFCPKIRDGDWVVGGFDLRLERNPGADEVWAAIRREGLGGRSEIVFTGLGEPTRRLDVLLAIARRLVDAGAPRVRVDTDGLASLREGRDVPPLLAAAGVGAVSVSLNAPDAATYARLCPSRYGAAAFEAVQEFIRSAVRCIPEVAASAVALPGMSEEGCRSVAERLGARFRWRPYDRL